jgi:prepilin-type processing-associated H-X9-DG protein
MAARRAATLIELMVVVSILATIAGITFPSLQLVRESSRANACRNNLHQIGIGLSNFEASRRHFPMGAAGRFDRRLSPTTMYDVSWWPDTLLYLEGASVADQLDRTSANSGWAALNSRNGKTASGFAPEFWFCPSSSVDRFVKVNEYQIAAPTYTGIAGATNEDGFSEARVNRCCRSEGQISAGGVLIPNRNVYSRQITDGLSKTMIVGEQSDFAFTNNGQPVKVAAAFAKGWLAGSVNTGVPPNYSDWLAPAHNLATMRYPLNEHRYDLPGIYLDTGANNPLLSAHPGIVNLLFCDGSVHAASELMDVRLLKSLATRDDSADDDISNY